MARVKNIDIETDHAQLRAWLSRNREIGTLEIRVDGHRVRLRGGIQQWAILQRLVTRQLDQMLDAAHLKQRH